MCTCPVVVKLLTGLVSQGHVVSVSKKRFAIWDQGIKRLFGIGCAFLWKNASSLIPSLVGHPD